MNQPSVHLSEAEAHYRDFYEHGPDMSVSIDASNARILYCNQTLADRTGYTKNEIIGRPVFEMYHPDCLETARSTFAEWVDKGEVHNAELQLQCRDGSAIDVILNVTSVRDESGKVIRSRSVWRDITERKRVERQLDATVTELRSAADDQARLAALVESDALAIINVRIDGIIEHWNVGAEQLLGYTPEEAIGQPITLMHGPGQVEQFGPVLRELEQGAAVREFETVRRHKDGRLIDVALSATLIRDEDGQPHAVCGLVRSISDRKRLEQQLAELADRERQQLARDLHDTIGQQLTSLTLHMAAVRQKFGDPAQDVAPSELEHIESSLQELRQQVRSTYQGVIPVHLDADGLRVALTVLAEEITQRHDVACRVGCPESIVLQENFVATQLYLIAREAVHNAIKHGSPTEVVITVSDTDDRKPPGASSRQTNADGLELSVTDNGTGLSDEDLESSDGMGLQIMRYRSNMIGADLLIEPGDNDSGLRITCLMRATES